jgi:hypothetical protein
MPNPQKAAEEVNARVAKGAKGANVGMDLISLPRSTE